MAGTPDWNLLPFFVAVALGTLFFVYPPAQHVPRKVTALRDYLVDVLAKRALALSEA